MDENNTKHANKKRSELRRTDRAVTDEGWIKAFVQNGRYGVLATAHNQQPYATPVNYVYIEKDQAIYFHGARFGRTRANIGLTPTVCFNIAEMGDVVPGEKMINFGVNYSSVTIFGTAELITNEEKILSVLVELVRKYFPDKQPGDDYPLPSPDELKRTALYAIHIEDWTAKKKSHKNK